MAMTMTQAQIDEVITKAAKYDKAQAKIKDYDLRYRTEQKLWKEKAVEKGIVVTKEDVLARIEKDNKK